MHLRDPLVGVVHTAVTSPVGIPTPAHVTCTVSVPQERVAVRRLLCANLVFGWGLLSYELSTSRKRGKSTHAHVHARLCISGSA